MRCLTLALACVVDDGVAGGELAKVWLASPVEFAIGSTIGLGVDSEI